MPCWRAAVSRWDAAAADEAAPEALLDSAAVDVVDVVLAVLAPLALGDQLELAKVAKASPSRSPSRVL